MSLRLAPKPDRKRSSLGYFLALTSAVLLLASAHVARAAGVVGTGTAASCTETALDGALARAGLVTFKCGASPVTLTVTSTKTISADTTIDGGSLITISGGHSVLVFSVNTGVKFTVQNLTIANGRGADGGSGGIANNVGGTLAVTNSTLSGNGGGGIDNYGTLTVTNSTFSGNGTDPGYGGGGIANLASGTLTVTNSTFTGNHSDGGGGIYNEGMLTVINSTVSGNSATIAAGGIDNAGGMVTVSGTTFSGNSTLGYASTGGAILNGGTLTITSSTFSGNSVSAGDSGRGGAIDNGGTLAITSSSFSGNSVSSFGGRGGGIANGGDLTVTNSTFSDNSAPDQFGQGGGIFNVGGTLVVTNSTFAGNSAYRQEGFGGGIFGQATARNTILADNFPGNCSGGITDAGHNLDDGTTCGFTTANGSLSNTNPQLDPAGLASNGGPTQTIALQAGSPAINAGDESVCAAAPVNNLDQRGYIRPGTGATRCSIGAYEYHSPGPGPTPTRTATPTVTPTGTPPTPTLTPTRPTSTPTATPTVTPTQRPSVVGNGTPESCTEAELDAALVGGGTVTFDCGASGVTITVTSTKTVSADTTIDGGGVITISGGNNVGVFSVNAGVTFTVENLTIANGHTISAGGIYNNGATLAITNSTFSGNSADVGGGAIVNYNGTLTVTNSTFAGNSAGFGGAISNNGGTLTVTNSTFAGNSAGAIENDGTLTVINSTFSDNSAGLGGVINNTATATLRNTIVANNTGGNCSGTITDGGHNIDDGTTCGFNTANGSLSNADPKLDPPGLASNGGPTQTIALQAGSPAINAGDESVCAAAPVNNLDQRGFVRPGMGYINCSIGAYEFDSSGPRVVCTGDCNGNGQVVVNEIIILVNIALGNAQPSLCSDGVPSGAEVKVTLIIQAVNAALKGCPVTAEQGCLASGGTVTSALCCASTGDFPDTLRGRHVERYALAMYRRCGCARPMGTLGNKG